jgi:FKBP-type peptidyl-prolyl cis-trans isomerase 2
VQYVGVSYSNGQEFDASWDRGEPFEFTLGVGQVIPGWDEGVEGMKEGGRRKLTIPADKAYGPQGSPPAIGPNETLVSSSTSSRSRRARVSSVGRRSSLRGPEDETRLISAPAPPLPPRSRTRRGSRRPR